MKQNIRLVHTRYVVDLLQDLIRRKVGTDSVENRCKDICINLPPRRRNTLVNKVMKWKLSEAKKCLQRERFNNTVEWRKGKTVIVGAGVLHDYERVWNLEQKRVREELKMKRKRKVRFLKKKYGQSRGTPDQLKGITIADRKIPATFTSEPKCYGGCSIDEKEKKIPSLPPKFAVYKGVNTTQCEAEIEKGMAKLRWTKRKQFGMDGENKDQTEEERRAVYDIKSKTFDFCSMKATDLPFNKRVHLPEPLEEESEIAIQNLKVKLNQITAK